MSAVVDITPLVNLESQAPAPVVETPELEPVDLGASESPLEEKAEGSAKPEDKAERANEERPEAKAELKPVEPRTIATSIHESLQKFFKEAKPTAEGKELLQKINAEVGSLYKQVAETKAAAKDVDEVISSAKELRELVDASDNLVYAGDPQIVENIYEDVVATNGDAEAFNKLVPAFVEKLKETNPESYYKQHVAPIYQHALQETGMVDAVRGLIAAYNKGDTSALRSGIEAIAKHISEVGQRTTEYTKAKAEAQATVARAQMQTQIQDSCELEMNKQLGAALKPLLQTTELGTYKRETLVELARHMRQVTKATLLSDKTFQETMGKLWKAPTLDVEKIRQVFNDKVVKIAGECTEKAIRQIYPHLSKRQAKKDATPKTVKTPMGNAVLLSAKPRDLDRSVKNSDTMEIAGYGYRKGSKQLITWRSRH